MRFANGVEGCDVAGAEEGGSGEIMISLVAGSYAKLPQEVRNFFADPNVITYLRSQLDRSRNVWNILPSDMFIFPLFRKADWYFL